MGSRCGNSTGSDWVCECELPWKQSLQCAPSVHVSVHVWLGQTWCWKGHHRQYPIASCGTVALGVRDMDSYEEDDGSGVAWVSKTVVVAASGDVGAVDGDSAAIHFRGRVPGTTGEPLIDTRTLLSQPFDLRVGKAFVVPELEEAVKSMSECSRLCLCAVVLNCCWFELAATKARARRHPLCLCVVVPRSAVVVRICYERLSMMRSVKLACSSLTNEPCVGTLQAIRPNL